jgi:peptidoglycan-associated lipoprotein
MSTISADASDPDGDSLAYRWSVPTGTIADPSVPKTTWTAPNQIGTVPATVTVDDGKGGTATDTVNILVIQPAVKEYTFEDVHFDFDRNVLKSDSLEVLDELAAAMLANSSLRVEIEGHADNIGTTEYNLALGERRAMAVRNYLAGQGIAATRIRVVSYGEERPAHDNTSEVTRRLNRRAALIVRVSGGN